MALLDWKGVLFALIQVGFAYNLSALYGPHLSEKAEILLPSSHNWTTALQQRWSTYEAPQYFGAIKPGTEEDVSNIVTISASHNIAFLVTGGGHGLSTTYARLDRGLNIDLGFFKQVVVDAEANTVTVGASNVYSDFYDPLYRAGKWIPTGTGTCVGVIGATLGAGIGPAQGLLGLGLDSLLSVRVVLASGQVVTASCDEHSDLFWAIRGGGANWGIILSATYRVYDLVNDGQVVNADFVFPGDANRTIWDQIAKYDQTTLPAELALTAIMSYNRASGQSEVMFNAAYFGTRAQAMPYLQPFIDARPSRMNVSTVPWNQLFYSLFFGSDDTECLNGQYISIYTAGLQRNDPATYESVYNAYVRFANATPGYNGDIVIERFPQQAVLAVPDNTTAYPWRRSATNIFAENNYANSSLDGAVNAFNRNIRAQFQETSGYPYLSTYVNYAQGDEGPVSWYSAEKLGRLREIKEKYDPNHLFKFDNPVD